EETFKLRGHDHVDQQNGNGDGEAEVGGGLGLFFVGAAEIDGKTRGNRDFAESVTDGFDGVAEGHAAGEGGRDVGDTLAVDAVDLGWAATGFLVDHGGDGNGFTAGQSDGNVVEILHALAVFGTQAHDD